MLDLLARHPIIYRAIQKTELPIFRKIGVPAALRYIIKYRHPLSYDQALKEIWQEETGDIKGPLRGPYP